MLVDDKPENLRLLVQILHTQHYIVNPATNGPAALRFLELATELPDIILLDIDMPGMSGYQVCSRLKENEATRDIPVIFISVGAQMVDKAEAFARGGVDYITKPFQGEEVLMRLNTHLLLREKQKYLEQRVQQQQLESAEFKAKLEQELASRQTSGIENMCSADINQSNMEMFSEREIQILTLLSSGIGNRDLAKNVFLSEATVKWHLRNIYRKLGVDNRSKAIFEAKKLALIS